MQSELTLSVKQRHGKSVLDDCFASPPLKLLTLPHETDGTLRAIQMSSSPGLLAGDGIRIRLALAEHTALSLGTQAFTRVLSMHAGQYAEQHTHITLAEGSRLTYLPHPLVLHTGSGLKQTTRIELADGCRLMYGEILAAGRVLNQETFAFGHLSSRLHIHYAGRPLVNDTIQWQPARHALSVLGQMEQHTHQLNLYFADTRPQADLPAQLESLYQSLSAAGNLPDTVLWGVSLCAGKALCLRALSGDAQSLQQLMHSAQSALPMGKP